MDLRHLRYFIAVAEEGSLTLAAEKRLHTAQPSLSRQMRDLELEIGVPLMTRVARGIELTSAGRTFLDHARLALAQVEAAGDAARRSAGLAKEGFVLGFLTGQEMTWMPEALRIAREALPGAEIVILSQSSPELAAGLMRGRVDVAFLRQEKAPGLVYRQVDQEGLLVILPADHRLAVQKSIHPQYLAREIFISVPKTTSPVLRGVIDTYLARTGIEAAPAHEVDNISMAISMVASTGGLALLPAYAQNLLPPAVVARPLRGVAPTIGLMIGYNKANTSPMLKRFLSGAEKGFAVRRAEKIL